MFQNLEENGGYICNLNHNRKRGHRRLTHPQDREESQHGEGGWAWSPTPLLRSYGEQIVVGRWKAR